MVLLREMVEFMGEKLFLKYLLRKYSITIKKGYNFYGNLKILEFSIRDI